MIHPNMATMLCFITTDADFSSKELKESLVKAIDQSFNMISVDMDTSTSDMVIVMSNNTKNANKKKFEELGSKIIILHNAGHITKDDGFTELPDVLEAIIK